MKTAVQLLFLTLVLASLASAQSNPPARFTDPDRKAKLATAFADVDRLFAEYVSRTRVPGAAWGIVIDGELAHVGTTGFRELESKSLVRPDSVFRIASMTKSFTAMAILKLRDDGRLSLDDPAEKFVPELAGLRYPSSDSPKITVRHLLSHSEGFPEDNPWGDQQLSVTDAEMTAMLKQGIPFSNAPGVAYEYSNYGFAILGRIVTRASGVPYRDYIATNILGPLGMTSTTLEPAAVPADRLAHGYRWEDERWKIEPQLPDGAFGAMGGMLTSLSDLAKYVAVYLDAWPPRDGAEAGPIRRSSLREMQQVSRPRAAFATRNATTGAMTLNTGGYGYGLGITQNCAFDHVVAHSGGLPGFGSLMQWLPSYGVGIIAFGNLTYTSWGRVAADAWDRLSQTGGLRPRAAQPSPSLVSVKAAVSRLVTRWDDEEANRIAAVNLFLDRASDRRKAEIEALRAKVGACQPDEQFEFVENALRGDWVMRCERGDLRVTVTLAPTAPPLVQHLEIAPASGPARPPACTP